MSHHVGICLTTLKSISLRWNMVQYVEKCPTMLDLSHHVGIRSDMFKLSNYVGICHTMFESLPPLWNTFHNVIPTSLESVPMLKYAPLCWNLFQNVGIHSTTLKYVSRCWNLPNSFRLCPTTLENLSIC